MASSDTPKSRASRLKLMAFDVDGVLTQGSLFLTEDGIEIKAFSGLDGVGMRMLQKAGVILAIISGRKARCVDIRARDLEIEFVFQGIEDKWQTMQDLLTRLGISADEAGFMGDDVVDLPAMSACGFSAAPPDSQPRVKRHAHLVTSQRAGYGAVREVCEFILDAQNKLDAALAPYLPTPRE